MRWLTGLLVILLFYSMRSTGNAASGITGKAGELVVVMPEKNWKTEAGDTVFNSLSQHVYGLPQAEPTFNVVHIKSSAFTSILPNT